jgi:hypothetical protein
MEMSLMTILKTKWFNAQIPLSLKETHKALLEHNYKLGNNNGFEIIEYSDDVLSAKFIERIFIKEIVVDPFGNESLFETVKYSIFEFFIISFCKNNYIIKVLSPPRSMKCFINSVYNILGFGFFISPVSFDLKIFLDTLESLLNPTQLKVIKISASGLVLTETSSAKLEITSSKHAYQDLFEKFHENLSIDNIKISLRLNGVDGIIEVSKMGSISFSDEYDSEITKIVQKLSFKS